MDVAGEEGGCTYRVYRGFRNLGFGFWRSPSVTPSAYWMDPPFPFVKYWVLGWGPLTRYDTLPYVSASPIATPERDLGFRL